ncbi:cyclin-dependent kinase [Salvia divinorum]|uniref:Cyclin-dependent kinase n=1 Tax=Salvia divinorum TaxID=28513 RepID=A0ABD1GXD9_SALDI
MPKKNESQILLQTLLLLKQSERGSKKRRRETPSTNQSERYEKFEKVGEGTYAKVYKAKGISTGQGIALKKTHLEIDEEGVPPTALHEDITQSSGIKLRILIGRVSELGQRIGGR